MPGEFDDFPVLQQPRERFDDFPALNSNWQPRPTLPPDEPQLDLQTRGQIQNYAPTQPTIEQYDQSAQAGQLRGIIGQNALATANAPYAPSGFPQRYDPALQDDTQAWLRQYRQGMKPQPEIDINSPQAQQTFDRTGVDPKQQSYLRSLSAGYRYVPVPRQQFLESLYGMGWEDQQAYKQENSIYPAGDGSFLVREDLAHAFAPSQTPEEQPQNTAGQEIRNVGANIGAGIQKMASGLVGMAGTMVKQAGGSMTSMGRMFPTVSPEQGQEPLRTMATAGGDPVKQAGQFVQRQAEYGMAGAEQTQRDLPVQTGVGKLGVGVGTLLAQGAISTVIPGGFTATFAAGAAGETYANARAQGDDPETAMAKGMTSAITASLTPKIAEVLGPQAGQAAAQQVARAYLGTGSMIAAQQTLDELTLKAGTDRPVDLSQILPEALSQGAVGVVLHGRQVAATFRGSKNGHVRVMTAEEQLTRPPETPTPQFAEGDYGMGLGSGEGGNVALRATGGLAKPTEALTGAKNEPAIPGVPPAQEEVPPAALAAGAVEEGAQAPAGAGAGGEEAVGTKRTIPLPSPAKDLADAHSRYMEGVSGSGQFVVGRASDFLSESGAVGKELSRKVGGVPVVVADFPPQFKDNTALYTSHFGPPVILLDRAQVIESPRELAAVLAHEAAHPAREQLGRPWNKDLPWEQRPEEQSAMRAMESSLRASSPSHTPAPTPTETPAGTEAAAGADLAKPAAELPQAGAQGQGTAASAVRAYLRNPVSLGDIEAINRARTRERGANTLAAELVASRIPGATVNLSRSTESAYVRLPNGEELRFSSHTKYGRNIPTDVNSWPSKTAAVERIDRAIRAGFAKSRRYGDVPSWEELNKNAPSSSEAGRAASLPEPKFSKDGGGVPETNEITPPSPSGQGFSERLSADEVRALGRGKFKEGEGATGGMYDVPPDLLGGVLQSSPTKAVYRSEGSEPAKPQEGMFARNVTRFRGLIDEGKRAAGKMFPTLNRLGESSGDAASHYVASKIYAKEAAPVIAHEVIGTAKGGKLDERVDKLAGAALVQDNLDTLRKERTAVGEDVSNMADLIGAEGSPFATRTDYALALKDPDVRAAIERYKEWFKNEADPNFRAAQGIAPGEDLPTRGEITGARVNLMAVRPEDPQTKTTVYGASRGNLTNVKLKPSPFARKAKGTGEGYEISLSKMIENTLGKGTEIANQHRLYEQLVKDKIAVIGKGGERPLIDGKPTRPLEIESARRFVTTQKGEEGTKTSGFTQPAKKLFIRADAYGEVYRAANVEEPFKIPVLSTVGAGLNKAALTAASEAMYHVANQVSVLTRTPGTGLIFPQMVKKGIQLMRGDPAVRKQLVELARIGALKEERPAAEGLAKLNPLRWMGNVIAATDRIGRLVVDDAFAKLVDKGAVEGGEQNRRDLLNQFGQYNKRAQNRLVAWLRDTNVNPFATAATNFYALGWKNLTLSPGMKATSYAQALRLRATVLARFAVPMAMVGVANYLKWGRVDGSANLPIGSIRLDDDKETGKMRYVNVLDILGPTRGLRNSGALAVIEGKRKGLSGAEIADKAYGDVRQGLIGPLSGPMVRTASVALTGHEPGGFQTAKTAEKGKPQAMENLKAAALGANPLIDLMTGGRNTQFGKFEVKTASKRDESPAEMLADRLSMDRLKGLNLPPSDKAKHEAREKLVEAVRENPSGRGELVRAAVDKGTIARADVSGVVAESQRDYLSNKVHGMELDDAMAIWDRASAKEREGLRPIVLKKIMQNRDKQPEERRALMEKVRASVGK